MFLRDFFNFHLSFRSSFFRIFCLLGIAFSGTACETVTEYVDEGLTLIGLGEEMPEKAKTPPKKPATTRRRGKPPAKTDPKAAAPDAPAPSAPATADSDIIIKKTETQPARKVEKKDLKSAQKPEFRVEAPVDVQKRVGGAARTILADADFIYLDFPQHFAVYDPELNFLARLPIAFPLKAVRKFKMRDKTYLYLTEENDVLEILELARAPGEQGDTWSLSDVISYEVGGKFFWIDGKTLLILLKDKLQFLDFTNFSEVKIINEVPIRDVSSALALGKYLYLSRKGFLDVLDSETFKTISSTRIGRNFDFLGISENGQGAKLVLALPDEKDNLVGVQYLSITGDYGGITDFGSVLSFEKPLTRYFFDTERHLFIGQEVDPQSDAAVPVRLYSLDEKRFLRGELSLKTDLLAWSMAAGKIHVVTPLKISVNALTLHPDVIAQAPLTARIERNKPTQPPLAQIGAPKTVKDEYSLTPEKEIEFMADARKAVLLDDKHFIVFENRPLKNFHQIYAADDFSEDNFTLKEPASPVQTTFTKALGTDFGMLTYSPALRKIFFLGVDFKELTELPVEAETLISWSNFTSPEGEVLVLSSKHERGAKPAVAKKPAQPAPAKPEKETVVGLGVPPPKPPPTPALTDGDYVVRLYLLKSPQEAELLSELFFNEKALALPSMENELAVLLSGEIRFYGLENMRQPVFNDTDKIELPQKRDFVSLKPFLIKNRAYALIREEDRLKVAAFNLTQPNEQVVLEDFEVTPEQFDGSSFSKGGQVFILPTTEGTLFYDMTELHDMPEDKRIVAHWDLPSEWVDVAKGGRFICVALGAKGVYCGDLLFY